MIAACKRGHVTDDPPWEGVCRRPLTSQRQQSKSHTGLDTLIHKVEELVKRFFILESYSEHEHIKADKTASRRAHWVEEL